MGFLRKANEAIFGYGSPTTLGVFRIIVGSLAFINFLMIAVDFEAWFTERGFVPTRLGEQFASRNADLPKLNLMFGIPDTGFAMAFYALVVVAAFCTAIGLWTRVATILLCVGTISLHMRNQAILHGGDTLLRACTLYLAIAPSGAACSVDRLIALWKGKAPQIPPLVSLWPQRLIQYQVAIVYFTTVWHKWIGNTWRDGTATWYVPQLQEFERFPVPAWVDSLPMVKFTTYATLIVELALATLVFYKPYRKWVLLSGLILHGVIEYRFNIPLFAFMMCSLYIAFYDGEEVTAWFKRLGERFRKFRLVVRTPKGMKLAAGPRRALTAIDPLDLVSIPESPGLDPHWNVETVDDRRLGPGAMARRMIGAWPWAWVPGVWSRVLRQGLIAEDAARPQPAPEKTHV
ncbi:MAG TPA: HTTM domain-containing protein [Fimbriimonadaceae bacterium]|nr:HTTM domain-containing protein [Fimbriimonadaceae bacterium]